MDYTGIARHLHNGQWYAAINDFRSPLLSRIAAPFLAASQKHISGHVRH